MIVLLLNNITFLADSQRLVVKLIPFYVIGIGALGLVYALYLRGIHPESYEMIGKLHDDELEDALVDQFGQKPLDFGTSRAGSI